MAKTIVICADGTWNGPEKRLGDRTTNVIRLARALRPSTPGGRCQVVFYDPGVGTAGTIDRLTGGAFGIGLSENIKDAYRFLAHNYEQGDEIFCFGFSRGAYTVRSLCGMVGAVGLLEQRDLDRLPAAFAYYRTEPAKRGTPQARRLVEGLGARPCPVKFLGVWDTVGALGVPITWLRWISKRWVRFHDETLGTHVEHAYQALAIDERRGPFRPSLWKPAGGRADFAPHQTVEQVWFPGAHANVGGGYRDTGLSDLALAWMVEKAESCGLAFDGAYKRERIRPECEGTLYDSRQGFYRLLRPHQRAILASGHQGETLHPAAIRRYRETGEGYNRWNLERALAIHAMRAGGEDHGTNDAPPLAIAAE